MNPLRNLSFRLRSAAAFAALAVLCACSGSADLPPPNGSPPPVRAPSILTQPANASVQAGQAASFSVTAAGTAPLSYQWQRGGSNIAGANSASYTTPVTVAGDTGATFDVVVSNAAGSVTSSNATLTVSVPGSVGITEDPTSLTVASGAMANFSAAATCSSGTIIWQWQRSDDGGATFANIGGATAATYGFTTAVSDTGAEFRAVASCAGMTATTSAAILTVTTSSGTASVTELPVGLSPTAELVQPEGIATDSAGNMIIVDSYGQDIRRLDTGGSVTTLAGSLLSSGSADGSGTAAKFDNPNGVAIGGDGTLFIADAGNNTIRMISTAGVVATLAGSAGHSGSSDGTGSAALFTNPTNLTFGSDGALYVADTGNYTIRRVTLAGAVTTLAGSPGAAGFANGTGSAARFAALTGIISDSAGNLYVADGLNCRIRKVTLAGVVSTFSGSGATDAADGSSTTAAIPVPNGLAISGNNLYVTALSSAGQEFGFGEVRKVSLTDGSVSTITGQSYAATAAQEANAGSVIADGLPDQVEMLFSPGSLGTNLAQLVAPADGYLYVTDTGNGALRKVDPTTGLTTTLVNRGSTAKPFSPDGVILPQAAFGDSGNNLALAMDPHGNVMVADTVSSDIRRITPAGAVSLVAGLHNQGGFLDGLGSGALMYLPSGVVSAPDGTIYFADVENHLIRRVANDGTVTTFAGQLRISGSADGAANVATFHNPIAIVMDSAGALYVADSLDATIRRIGTDGSVTTIAGSPGAYGTADGTGSGARFDNITSLTIDSHDILYVGDNTGHVSGATAAIRAVTTGGVVSTVFSGSMDLEGLAVAADGSFYVVDVENDIIRHISGASTSTAAVFGNASGSLAPIALGGGITVMGAKKFAIAASKAYGTHTFESVYVLTLP